MPLFTEFIINEPAYENDAKHIEELDAMFTDDELPDEPDNESFLGVDTPFTDPQED
jgi:hypothetical protein